MAARSYSRGTILDCRSHTLSEAPCLRVGLRLFSASVVDGKIYVAGSGLKNPYQVLDTKAQVWDLLPSCETGFLFFQKTASIEGKFHVVTTDNELVAYDPKEGKWDAVGRRVGWHMNLGACCEIGNVLYAASASASASASAYASVEGVFSWYDTVEGVWRNVTGLVGLPKFTCKSRVKLADYGGKMGVLWEEKAIRFQPLPCGRREPWPRTGYMETKIWCAEIALERRNRWEIWGKVEWLDHVLTVPGGSEVVKLLAATL